MSEPVPAACVRKSVVCSWAAARRASASSIATWNGAGSIRNSTSPRLTLSPFLTATSAIGPLTWALTETMSCLTAALSVSTDPPLASHQ
jgi:hypothetical protein